MTYANGQIPRDQLAELAGNPGKLLRRDAAAAFNAMAHVRPTPLADAYRPLGVPGDYARGRWSQWYAWEAYRYHGGALAAVPGTSNHGWGLAIDLHDCGAPRAVIDGIGAHYGWSKAWSDAPGECWHICWRPGVWHPPPTKYWRQWDAGGQLSLNQFASQIARCEVSTLLRQTATHYGWFNDPLARYLNDWADGKISARTARLYGGARFWVYR